MIGGGGDTGTLRVPQFKHSLTTILLGYTARASFNARKLATRVRTHLPMFRQYPHSAGSCRIMAEED